MMERLKRISLIELSYFEIYILIKKYFKNNYPYKKPDDKYFRDLLNKILVKDPRNRISWDEYFNHPFFTGKEIPLEIMNLKSMFTSFNYEYDNPNIKGSLLQPSINNDINEGILM